MAEKVPSLQANERFEITLFTGHLEGLCALTAWLDGFEAAGKGSVPGHFELVMHIREIMQARQAARSGGGEGATR